MVITIVTIVLWTSLFSLYLLSLLLGRFIVPLDIPFVYTHLEPVQRTHCCMWYQPKKKILFLVVTPGNWTIQQTLPLSCAKISHMATLPKINTGQELYFSLSHLAISLSMWLWPLISEGYTWSNFHVCSSQSCQMYIHCARNFLVSTTYLSTGEWTPTSAVSPWGVIGVKWNDREWI